MCNCMLFFSPRCCRTLPFTGPCTDAGQPQGSTPQRCTQHWHSARCAACAASTSAATGHTARQHSSSSCNGQHWLHRRAIHRSSAPVRPCTAFPSERAIRAAGPHGGSGSTASHNSTSSDAITRCASGGAPGLCSTTVHWWLRPRGPPSPPPLHLPPAPLQV
jgi:hypothetical protein